MFIVRRRRSNETAWSRTPHYSVFVMIGSRASTEPRPMTPSCKHAKLRSVSLASNRRDVRGGGHQRGFFSRAVEGGEISMRMRVSVSGVWCVASEAKAAFACF